MSLVDVKDLCRCWDGLARPAQDQGTGEVKAAGDADLLASEKTHLGANFDGAVELSVDLHLCAQECLVVVAKGDEPCAGFMKDFGGRPVQFADRRFVYAPLNFCGQARVAGIAPVEVPTRCDVEQNTDAKRFVGLD